MAAGIHVGDVGTSLQVQVKDEDAEVVDLSSASTLEIWLSDPDGNVSAKTASLVNSGTDGLMEYVTQTGDISREGPWRLQGYVEVGGAEFHSDIHKFKVSPNLM